MASGKDTFAAGTFAGHTFACGTWRGLGVSGDLKAWRLAAGQVYVSGAVAGQAIARGGAVEGQAVARGGSVAGQVQPEPVG